MSSLEPPGALLELENIVRDLQKTRLVSAVGLVILLYDHLLSLDDEVRFIWSARFTSSKVLFLALRYIVPVIMLVHTVHRNRPFIIATLFFFVGSTTVVLVLSGIGFHAMLPSTHFEPLFHVCIFDAASHIRVLWLPGLLFQSMMVLALSWKLITHPQTFKTLLEEGYPYFLFLFGINVLNTTMVLVVEPFLMFVTVFFMWCFTTTATCRMILSLRRSSFYARDAVDESETEPRSEADPRLELSGIPHLSRTARPGTGSSTAPLNGS
ncbi:hypothetical protein DFH06DRAFT_1317016 [Mycena polygramma]|nr:hypothetical protein DFH06DRAFT_1317016 [Mycena polygramma]